MNQSTQDFIHPHTPFHGTLSPEALRFDTELQKFSQQVGYISGLHTGGKISSAEAFDQINQLWNDLNASLPSQAR